VVRGGRAMPFVDRRLKVAFLSFDFGEYSIRLASALAREVEVLLLLAREVSLPYLTLVDKAVSFQPFSRPRLRHPLQQILMICTVLQQIKRFNPDVIHLQRGHLWFNFALPLLRRYPLVLTIHDPRHHVGDKEAHKTPQIIMDFGSRRARQVIVHAEQLKHMVVEQLRIPSAMVHVIPHIVLGEDTSQNPLREEDRLILFYGRIWEYKGLEYLIRAEPLITARVPDAKIVIAGQGEHFARYRDMMIHPENFIVHNEYVSRDRTAELFQRASLVVLPYIDASQSGVIPLAYTFSKPVVATTVGGLPEMVDHGRTGYLVPPRDEKALADAIVRLLCDRELRHQQGANGKRKVDTECSPYVVARQTLAVYHHAINSI
jgi:glycosyltransferase involved in cell wall biosynthesis